MYQLLRHISTTELFVRQLPVFVASFTIATLFYKFGSFGLECVAFLATWFVLDLAMQGLVWLFTRHTSMQT